MDKKLLPYGGLYSIMSINKGRNTGERIDGKFLRGPIPWAWLEAAGQLPGQALHVGLIIWLLRGLNKSPRVRMEKKYLRSLGVSHGSYYRGLAALEKAGLAAVDRKRGRSTEITILDRPKLVSAPKAASADLPWASPWFSKVPSATPIAAMHIESP